MRSFTLTTFLVMALLALCLLHVEVDGFAGAGLAVGRGRGGGGSLGVRRFNRRSGLPMNYPQAQQLAYYPQGFADYRYEEGDEEARDLQEMAEADKRNGAKVGFRGLKLN